MNIWRISKMEYTFRMQQVDGEKNMRDFHCFITNTG
jgi:hypothetical protein